MKNNKLNLKAIVLSLGLAAMMLSANASAQEDRPGGLFGNGGFLEKLGGLFETDDELRTEEGDYALFTEQFGNGTDGNYNISTEQFGQQDDAPLGSGLLILVAAGAGYAFTKRKQNQ